MQQKSSNGRFSPSKMPQMHLDNLPLLPSAATDGKAQAGNSGQAGSGNMLSELRARLAMGNAEQLASEPLILSSAPSQGHLNSWSAKHQTSNIQPLPIWSPPDWRDGLLTLPRTETQLSAAHSQTTDDPSARAQQPLESLSRRPRVSNGHKGGNLVASYSDADFLAHADRVLGLKPSHALVGTGQRISGQSRDSLLDGLGLETAASTDSLPSLSEDRTSQDGQETLHRPLPPRSVLDSRSQSQLSPALALWSEPGQQAGLLDDKPRRPTPGIGTSLPYYQHVAQTLSQTRHPEMGGLFTQQACDAARKEPSFLEILRANSSTEQDLAGPSLPNSGHRICQLGSGRIAADLAKSIRPPAWDPCKAGVDSGSRPGRFTAAANFGTGSLALQIAQGKQSLLACSPAAEASIKSSPGHKEIMGSPSASRHSFAEQLDQSSYARQTRSKTSRKGSAKPFTTRLSDLSVPRHSEASASFNSATLEPSDIPRSPSPVSRLKNGLRPENGMSLDSVRVIARSEIRAEQDQIPAARASEPNDYLTKIPENIFPALAEERPASSEPNLLPPGPKKICPPTEKSVDPRLGGSDISPRSRSLDNLVDIAEPAQKDCSNDGEREAQPRAEDPGTEGQAKNQQARPAIPVSGFAAEDAPGWRPPSSPSRSEQSPPKSGSSGGKDDSGGSRFWTVHSLNSWAHGDRGSLLHSKSSIQSLPSFRSWAGVRSPNGGEDPAAIRWRKSVHLRRWSSRAKSPSKAARLAKANALRSVQSNQERSMRCSPPHSHSSNEGSKSFLRPSKRQTIESLQTSARLEEKDAGDVNALQTAENQGTQS